MSIWKSSIKLGISTSNRTRRWDYPFWTWISSSKQIKLGCTVIHYQSEWVINNYSLWVIYTCLIASRGRFRDRSICDLRRIQLELLPVPVPLPVVFPDIPFSQAASITWSIVEIRGISLDDIPRGNSRGKFNDGNGTLTLTKNRTFKIELEIEL